MVMLWRDKGERGGSGGGGSFGEEPRPTGAVNWGAAFALRGHASDVYDLCWSPGGAAWSPPPPLLAVPEFGACARPGRA